MANILSQDEVDSLLGGIDEGKVETETDVPVKEESVEVYDFSGQERSAHLSMPALGLINERLIGFLKASFSKITGLGVDVTLSSMETHKFSEFCQSLPVPTSFNIFKMEPLRGFALLVLEGSLVFSFIDSVFGGRGESHSREEGKGFTAIESRIIEKIVNTILKDLEKAWVDTYKIRTFCTRSETDPQFAAIALPNDSVIISKMAIDFQNASGLITFCMPCSTLELAKEKLRQGIQEHKLEVDETWSNYLKKRLMKLPVDINCSLGSVRINGEDLLRLKIDDVIELDQKVKDAIPVTVAGVEKFKGYPGSSNNKKAIKISERINRE